jgi:hypothetical protein
MDCTHIYTFFEDGVKQPPKTFDSILGLAQWYYKSNAGDLDKRYIFSTDNTAKTTFDALAGVLRRKNEIKTNTKTSIATFVTQDNSLKFAPLGIRQSRLSPEYQKDSRILYTILREMLPGHRDKFQTLDELRTYVVTDPQLKKRFDEEYAKISQILEVEELTKEFGISLHNAISNILEKGFDVSTVVQSIIRQHSELLEDHAA